MDRRKFDRRAVALAKDVLILFLTCSAVWLLIQTRMLEPLHNILREDMPQTQMGQTEGGSRIEAVRPLRIAVNLTAGMEAMEFSMTKGRRMPCSNRWPACWPRGCPVRASQSG